MRYHAAVDPGWKRRLAAGLFVVSWLAAVSPQAQAQAVGAHVEFVDGAVSIVDARGQTRLARVNDAIEVGDTVVTGANGELHARTEDHGFIAVRPDTRVRIDAYRANGDKDDNVAISLLRGALRSVTGWIGKHNPDKYAIRTPTATIGIRGTDHEPSYVPPPEPGESSPVPPGTYEKVNTGTTVIQNAAGQLVVSVNQSGFAPHDARLAPRLLERVPGIYRPTANESKIEERKEALARQAETKRAERIKETREKESKAQKEREDARKKADRRRHRTTEK